LCAAVGSPFCAPVGSMWPKFQFGNTLLFWAMKGVVEVNCSSSFKYTFHIVVYTPPIAAIAGSLLLTIDADAAMPVSSAVTRPSNALTVRPTRSVSVRRLVRNGVMSGVAGSSFQYFSTSGGMPMNLLNESRTLGSTFGYAFFADAYFLTANSPTVIRNW